MNFFSHHLGHLLAASDQPIQTLEFTWPQHAWQWAVYGGGLTILFALSIVTYLRDTASLPVYWRLFLTSLRWGVLACLVVIALNPQQRTQKTSFRPSRVALLVDTSLSMRYPATAASTTPANQSRADAIVDVLGKSQLIEELNKQHEVSVYTFDSKLNGPQEVFAARNDPQHATDSKTASSSAKKTPNWGELLQPRGLETRLGESLLDAIRQLSGKTLSGIVVLSDGGSNAGIDAMSARDIAQTAGVRLVTVGVGSTEPPVNLQIASVQAPTDVHLGDPYEISAFVQGQGFAGKSVEVQLLSKPEGDDGEPTLLESQEISLHEDRVPVAVKFRQTPSAAGTIELLLRAKPRSQAREISDDDNERRKMVNVIDRKMRILLAAGGPMREYQFVRNILHRHSAVSVDVWLQTVQAAALSAISQEADRVLPDFPATAPELNEYDVIVAFDPDWKQLPPERLALLSEWVSQRAGGLILVAGDVFTSELAGVNDALQPVRDLYPVFLSTFLLDLQYESSSSQAWPIVLSREGLEAAFLQLVDEVTPTAEQWAQFPGVYRCYPSAGVKAGAIVYAQFSDPRTQTEFGPPVLFASQFFGSGKTFYIGSPELWRLRSINEDYYERLWTKLIREVGQGRLQRGTSRGMLLLERNEYVLGQTVRVRAQLLNGRLEPLETESVAFDIFDPKGKAVASSRELFRDKNRPGQYSGDFRASMPGTYRIEIPIPDSNEQLKSRIDVVLPNLESDDPRQNVSLLAHLARDTGGEYLRIDEAKTKLPSLLPNRSEEVLVDERLRTLWDRQWVLLVMVGLLTAEWFTRKMLRLA